MRRSFISLTLITLSSLAISGHCAFAQDQAEHRKVVTRVAPEYPPLARTMAIAGTVRIEAVVSGSGSVKTAEIKGGHPMLADAALRAVKKWRWENASHDTHETVELKFEPTAYH
jgi:protein TonB